MTKKVEQNAEVYTEITSSGKSLLELYMDLKEENKALRKIVYGAITFSLDN